MPKDRTDSYVPNIDLPPPLESDEAILAFVEQCVQEAESARLALQIAVPGVQSRSITVADMRNAERIYLVRLGAALAVTLAYFRIGRLSSIAYNAFIARAKGTTVPTRSKEPVRV